MRRIKRQKDCYGRGDMWKNVKIIGIIIFLLICSIQDIKEKRISVKRLVLFGVLFLGMSLAFENRTLEERLYSMLPGMIAFALAFLTKEQVGYGDAACLAVLGSAVSSAVLLGAVMGGLFLISVCSMVLLAGKKADRKTTLPFLPFLTAGMLWQIIQNGN